MLQGCLAREMRSRLATSCRSPRVQSVVRSIGTCSQLHPDNRRISRTAGVVLRSSVNLYRVEQFSRLFPSYWSKRSLLQFLLVGGEIASKSRLGTILLRERADGHKLYSLQRLPPQRCLLGSLTTLTDAASGPACRQPCLERCAVQPPGTLQANLNRQL